MKVIVSRIPDKLYDTLKEQLAQKGQTMDGYLKGLVFNDMKPVMNTEKAEIVRQIYNRFLQGAGICEIAYELDRQKSPLSQNGKKWHSTAVRYILLNEKYTGDYIYQKKIHNRFPAIPVSKK